MANTSGLELVPEMMKSVGEYTRKDPAKRTQKTQTEAKEGWRKYNEAGVKEKLDEKERKLFYFWNRNKKRGKTAKGDRGNEKEPRRKRYRVQEST